MAQFYTKERSIGNASPQIYDDSQRVLKQAEDIIESMRAVSAIEEQQNATLINNLRAHRQRDKELNTRNHQLLMDNMRQVAEVKQRNDKVAMQDKALKRKEAAEQDARTMAAIASLTKLAGQASAAFVKQGLEQARNEMEDKIKTAGEVQQRDPQSKAADGLGLDSQLAIDRESEVASLSVATLAKEAGKDLGVVAGIFINQARLEREAAQLVADNIATAVERGKLDDIIRQNPDKIVSYNFNGETKEIALRDVASGQVGSSEELSRIYGELNDELFAELKKGRDPTLFLQADKKTRNAINSRVLQYSNNLSRRDVENYNATKLASVLIGETIEDRAKNTVQYINESRINPTLGYGAATNNITNKILPATDNPVAFARALGELEFKHMPGVPISKTPFGKKLLQDAQQLQRVKEEQVLRDATTKGVNLAKQRIEASVSDGTTFNSEELQTVYNDIENKYEDGTISFEVRTAALNYTDTQYQRYSSNKATIEYINDLRNDGQLTQEILDENRSKIPSELYKSASEEIASLNKVTLPNGLRYSKKSVRAQLFLISTNAVKRDEVSGQPKHPSAIQAADKGVEEYLRLYKGYLEEFTPNIAAEKAYADVVTKMTNEEGIFFVDRTSGETAFYSRLTPGDHTGALKVPTRSIDSPQQIGYTLRGDGISLLDVKEYTAVDANLATYAAQINAGQPVKLTSFDQAVAAAAGIPEHEMLNRRFEALGIDAEATEGGIGVLRRAAEISPALTRLINSQKTLNTISSVTDRVPDVLPARTGVGALGFHNVSSIARKFGHPNPELIAGIWSARTNDGKNQPDKTPGQQVKDIIEQNPNYNMFIPYAEVAQLDPSAAVYMAQYGPSHESIAGMSRAASATYRSIHSNPVDRGGLLGLVMEGESSNQLLIYNKGTTRDVGYFPANATFGSVEKAQSEGKAFAAGGLQMTPGVLNQGRVAAGISDNANFNSLNNQSKAFWGLILNTNKRPALRDYLLGKSNDINAAHLDLANEFAAIEGPSGRGSYDGDSAGNKANTKASAVRAALKQARSELASNPINF